MSFTDVEYLSEILTDAYLLWLTQRSFCLPHISKQVFMLIFELNPE